MARQPEWFRVKVIYNIRAILMPLSKLDNIIKALFHILESERKSCKLYPKYGLSDRKAGIL